MKMMSEQYLRNSCATPDYPSDDDSFRAEFDLERQHQGSSQRFETALSRLFSCRTASTAVIARLTIFHK